MLFSQWSDLAVDDWDKMIDVNIKGYLHVIAGVINTGWADKVSDPAGRKVAQELNKIAIAPGDVVCAVVHALDQPANVTVNDLIVSPIRQNW